MTQKENKEERKTRRKSSSKRNNGYVLGRKGHSSEQKTSITSPHASLRDKQNQNCSFTEGIQKFLS
jgi:hypothetical protein